MTALGWPSVMEIDLENRSLNSPQVLMREFAGDFGVQAVNARERAGLGCSPELLAHVSPLGWANILLTGEYRWKK